MHAENADRGEQSVEGPEHERKSFIQKIVEEDLAAGSNEGRFHTPLSPRAEWLSPHRGTRKRFASTFGMAEQYAGKCNLRFDDTNPAKEETRFVDAIIENIRWLGFDWEDRLFFASGYFEKLYSLAEELIEKGKAFVCDLNSEEMREYRGSLTEVGKDSPYRGRSPEENLDLFRRMRAGEFGDGEKTLRAKVDMQSPNLNMRDPVMYRILHQEHHRTGDAWCIYPTYDWAHGQSDALEAVTHSLCSLEFENHRPLYDWYLDQLDLPARPRQIEFARLELTYTLTSKRKLRHLVEEGYVDGWDDPRMPTLEGIRRRGVPPEAIRAFCDEIGVAKHNSTIDMVKLDNAVREHLNRTAVRRMAVLDPIKVVITNYPEGQVEELEAVNNPEDPSAGVRKLPFAREVWIEREDFREEAPRKFFRLVTGREVRLRYAYVIRCDEVIKDDAGEIIELRCTYDPESGGGKTSDGRKVKGIIHWVSVEHAHSADVVLYDHLFAVPQPEEGEGYLSNLNPDSKIIKHAQLEPALADAAPGDRCQFERVGYFCADPVESASGAPAFHRIVSLRDAWARIEKRGR